MAVDPYSVLIERLSRLSEELAALHPQIADALKDQGVKEEFQFKHAERLATLGTLMASICHEIKNFLAAALLNSENALAVKDDANLLHECLVGVTSAVVRCQSTVHNVLRYARQESSEKELTDLNSMVHRAVELTKHYIADHKAVIDVHLVDELPRVAVNAIEIEQVLVNLIRNAVQEGDGTTITVSTDKGDDAVRVRVCDNGHGIAEADLQHVFDAFVTSRHLDDTTGLGLTISQRIIEDHGGSIEVESQVGQGSKFTITLPLNLARPAAGRPKFLDSAEKRRSK